MVYEEAAASDDITFNVDDAEVIALLYNNYGMALDSITHLYGYDDKNYRVENSNVTNRSGLVLWEHGYVLKIMNKKDSAETDFIEDQHCLMKHLHDAKINVPQPQFNLKNKTFSIEDFVDSKGHAVRLLTYWPGPILVDVDFNPELLCNIGKFAAKLTISLETFHRQGFEDRDSIWMLENAMKIRSYINVVEDRNRKKLVENALQEFDDKVIPKLNELERGVIHGDLNEHNLVIENNDVYALLDFGDSHESLVIFDLAICMCYMFIKSNEVEYGKHIIKGYKELREINNEEKALLKTSICARLCQSLVLGLETAKKNPFNKYILSSQKTGWNILETLFNLDEESVSKMWDL